MLAEDDPRAASMIEAIRRGDDIAVRRLLDADPGLAAEPIWGTLGSARTPLHVVTDWPGFLPNAPAVTRTLIEAGADPDARVTGGKNAETPLHLVASNDDADVGRALIDGGADIEIPGGSIGTPLDNAIGYGCWNVARLLVSQGARVDKVWHAAALGMSGRLRELLVRSHPSAEELSEAFLAACGGGQRRTAELLLSVGADIDAAADYGRRSGGRSPLQAAAALGTARELLVGWLRARGDCEYPRDRSG